MTFECLDKPQERRTVFVIALNYCREDVHLTSIDIVVFLTLASQTIPVLFFLVAVHTFTLIRSLLFSSHPTFKVSLQIRSFMAVASFFFGIFWEVLLFFQLFISSAFPYCCSFIWRNPNCNNFQFESSFIFHSFCRWSHGNKM